VRKTWRIAAVPDPVREALVDRLERHVEAVWKDRCRGIAVRFRNEYAYVEAQPVEEGDPPVRLGRLEYLGKEDEWAFAFYKYSDERYEPCILPNGSFTGTPEECFDCAANVYLHGW
jgi:hypothetical protein